MFAPQLADPQKARYLTLRALQPQGIRVSMSQIDRRKLVASIALALGGAAMGPAAAQQGGSAPQPAPNPAANPASGFSHDDVLRRARELASAPLTAPPALLEALAKIDQGAWREIRFKAERSLLGNNANGGGAFRLQPWHLGGNYRQPVIVNTIRDGIATPVPYAANLFDYGGTKFEKPLPVNTGFAGFRLTYPLNDPRNFDEAVSFLGASAFRFVARGQRSGASMRGLAVNLGGADEETPFFREFWIETPEPGADRIIFHALLDGEAATGAYRFELRPGVDSTLNVKLTLFARKTGVKLSFAPIISMFHHGEGDRRAKTDFKPEAHDSDGLLINASTGEWLWRPLRNPAQTEVSAFMGKDARGFGLMQRDRNFDHYQDLELGYERRPSLWVEPVGDWGEGHVELIEAPGADEGAKNIMASWVPAAQPELGKPFSLAYRITATQDLERLSPAGRAVSAFTAPAKGAHRVLIDFAGGELPFFLTDAPAIEVVATASQGKIVRSFVTPNPFTKGLRATVDLALEPGQTADLRVALRNGPRILTETWTTPFRAE